MPHFIYIPLRLKYHKYYIGEISDVETRLLFHNAGKQRSVKKRIPFIIIITELIETRQQALHREKQIKS